MSLLKQLDSLLSDLSDLNEQVITKKDRLIVLTGVTSGFGNGLAHEFLKRGYMVSGCGRNELKLKQLTEQYKNNPNCLFSKVELTNEKEIIKWTKNTINKFNTTPRLIINNAALLIIKPILNTTGKEFNDTLNTNVIAPFYVIKNYLKYMKTNTKFKAFIVNVSTCNFGVYEPNTGPYIASKFALEGLTRSILPELPSHIGICCMWPGVQYTKMGAEYYTDKRCKEENVMKSDEFVISGKPNVIDWLMALNKKEHNGKSVGPQAEYLSLLRVLSPDMAKKFSAGNGFKFDYFYPQN